MSRRWELHLMRHWLSVLGVLALTSAPALADPTAATEPVTAHVETGDLAGRLVGTVAIYKNIPFAAPPVGPLRWKPPQPAASWTGVRDAGEYGPACPQMVNASGKPNGGGYVGPTSEDCLSLNIFAPYQPWSSKRAPVMVWIYGGGNSAGANSLPSTDGRGFARDGVVVVEVGYRIGALGFFAHPALTHAAAPGEPLGAYGIMDQVAALKWVKRNIAAFGGDPTNVTIFGESAGGADVLTLMATPSARGLFQKAAVESGGGWSAPESLAKAEQAGVATAKAAGAPADATLDQLRALPTDALVKAQGRIETIVDGRFLTGTATQAFARGQAAPVPLLIGSNSYEASLLGPNTNGYLKDLPIKLRPVYAASAPDDLAYANAVFTDSVMGAPARWIAAKASDRPRSWLYYFSYVRVVRRGRLPGANHASEIPYVFDSQGLVPNYSAEVTDEDRAMAKVVHSCWVAFAKTGIPICTGAPAWPAYARSSERLMEFGLATGVREHFRKAQLDAVQDLQAELLDGR
jgi:para-nitrobenzyl esterase